MNALANDGLVFGWEPPRQRQLAILGFLGASAAVHALCFYLFQIVYPPTVALLPPPGRINLISNNTEEGRTLLRWIAAEDPALASTTQRSADAKAFHLPKLNHVPSYLTIRPELQRLPSAPTDVRPRTAQPPSPVPVARAQNPPAAAPSSTAIIFSKDLDSLGAVRKPVMKLTASTRELPQSARFRVAVSDRGVVRYCFLESSSGDAALDEQARRYLALCRFDGIQNAVGQNQLHWAVAIIEWGNDIATPPPSPVGKGLP